MWQVMFSKLDKILLLAHGFPVFLGHPQEIDTFFKRHGRPVPRGTHPAEHILSVVSRPDALVAVLNSIFCPNNRVAEESGRSGVVRRAMHSVILDGELSQQLATEAKPKIPCFARAVHSIRRSMLDLKVISLCAPLAISSKTLENAMTLFIIVPSRSPFGGVLWTYGGIQCCWLLTG